MVSISRFNKENSKADLFAVPFCICLQASAYEQYSTALLLPALTGSNHDIPLKSANQKDMIIREMDFREPVCGGGQSKQNGGGMNLGGHFPDPFCF